MARRGAPTTEPEAPEAPPPTMDDGPVAPDDPYAVLLGTAQPSGSAALVRIFNELRSDTGMEFLEQLAEGDPQAFGRAMDRLRGFARKRALALEQLVSERLEAKHQQMVGGQTLADHLGELAPDALVALHVPWGYRLDRRGTWRVSLGNQAPDKRLAGGPAAIFEEDVDVATGEVSSTVGWLGRTGTWEMTRVPRGRLMEPAGLVGLTTFGAPWSSIEAKDLVSYFVAFERANPDTLQRNTTTSHLGWHGGRFVLPKETIGGKPPPMRVVPDPGFGGYLAGWTPRGSFAEWLRLREVLDASPLMYLGLYASLATPLLPILNSPSFAVDWSGITSGGKTSTLRLAASVWGDPREGAGVMQSWSDTGVHLERYAGFVHALPVILDDTKSFRARGTESISAALYLFSQGRGRGRGALDGGVQKPTTWNTILLSSGEAPLASATRDGGAWARVLHVRGRPLGSNPAWGRDASRFIADVVEGNHGHAGPLAVRWLVEHRREWPKLVARYRAFVRDVTASYNGRVVGRLAGYLGVLDTARVLCTEALGLPEPEKAPIDLAIQEVIGRAATEDLPYEAYEVAVSWAGANQDKFWPRGDRAPTQGWFGRWERGDDVVWVLQGHLTKALEEQGYRYAELEDAWEERGLIRVAHGRRRHQVTVGHEPMMCVGLYTNKTVKV